MEYDDDLDEDDTFFRIEEASDDSYDSDEIKVDIRQFNGPQYNDDEDGLRQAQELSRRTHEEEKYKRIEDIAIRKSIRAERRRRRAEKREEEAILATIANSIAEEPPPAYAQYARVPPVQKIGRASSAVYTDHIKYASSAIQEHRAASAMHTDHIKYASSALYGKHASTNNLHLHERHHSHAAHNASMYSSPKASSGGSFGAISPPQSPGEPIIINTLTMEALELHNLQTAARKQPLHSNARRDAELEAALRLSELEARNQYIAPPPTAAPYVGSPPSGGKSAYDVAMDEAIRRSREEAERQEVERALALSQQAQLLSGGGRNGARVHSPPLAMNSDRPNNNNSSSNANSGTDRGLRHMNSRGKSAYDLELEEAMRLSKLEQERAGGYRDGGAVISTIPITPTSVSSQQLKASQSLNNNGPVPSASGISKTISTPVYRSESPAVAPYAAHGSGNNSGTPTYSAPPTRSSALPSSSSAGAGAVRGSDSLSRPSTASSAMTPFTPSSLAQAKRPSYQQYNSSSSAAQYRTDSPPLMVKEDSPPQSSRPVPAPTIHVDYSIPPSKIAVPPSPPQSSQNQVQAPPLRPSASTSGKSTSTLTSTVPAPPSATSRSQTAPLVSSSAVPVPPPSTSRSQTAPVTTATAAAPVTTTTAAAPVLSQQTKSAPSMMGLLKRFTSTNSPTKPEPSSVQPSRPLSARNVTATAEGPKVSRVASLDSIPPSTAVKFTPETVSNAKPVPSESAAGATSSPRNSLQRNKSSAEQQPDRPSSGKFFGLLRTRSTSPTNNHNTSTGSMTNPSPDRGSKGKSFFSSLLGSTSQPPPVAPSSVVVSQPQPQPSTANKAALPLPRTQSKESNASSREETTLDDPAVKRFMELRAQKKMLMRRESLRMEILEQARSMHVPSSELEDYVAKVLEEREALEASRVGIAGATSSAAISNVMKKVPSDTSKMSGPIAVSSSAAPASTASVHTVPSGSGKISQHSGSGKMITAAMAADEHKADVDEMVGVNFNELNDSKELEEDNDSYGEMEAEEKVDEEEQRRLQEQEEAEMLRKQLMEDAEEDRRNVEKRQAEQYEMYKAQREQQEKQNKAEQLLLEKRRTEQRLKEQQQAQQFEIFQREQLRLAEEAAEQQRLADEAFAREQYEQMLEQERLEEQQREQQRLEQQQKEAEQKRRQEQEAYEQQQKEKKRLELVHQENLRQEQLQKERERAERDRLQKERELAEIQKLKSTPERHHSEMGMMEVSPAATRVALLRQEFQRNNSLSPQSSFYQAPSGAGLQRTNSGSPVPNEGGMNSLQRRQQLQSQYLSAIKGPKSDSQSTILSSSKLEKVSDVTSGSSQATSSPSGVQLAPITPENLQQVQTSLYSESKTTSFTSTSGSFYAQREASVAASVDAKKYPNLAETMKYKDPNSFQETQFQQEQRELKHHASNEQLLQNLHQHYNLQPPSQSSQQQQSSPHDLTIRLPSQSTESPPPLQRQSSNSGFHQSGSDKIRTPGVDLAPQLQHPRKESFSGSIQYDNSPQYSRPNTAVAAATGPPPPYSSIESHIHAAPVAAPSSARYGTTTYVKPVSPKNGDVTSNPTSSPAYSAPPPVVSVAPVSVQPVAPVQTPKAPVVDPQTALTSAMALLTTAMAPATDGQEAVDKNAAMIAAVSLIKQAMATTDASNPQNAALTAALTLLTGIQASTAVATPAPVAPQPASQQVPLMTKQYSQSSYSQNSPQQSMQLPPPVQQQQQQQYPPQVNSFGRKTSESNMDYQPPAGPPSGYAGYDHSRGRTDSINSYNHAPGPSAAPYGVHRTSSREHMEWQNGGGESRGYYPQPHHQQQALPSPAAFAAQQQHQKQMYGGSGGGMGVPNAPANTPSNYYHHHGPEGGNNRYAVSPTRSASMSNVMSGPSLVRDPYAAPPQPSHSQSMFGMSIEISGSRDDPMYGSMSSGGHGHPGAGPYYQHQQSSSARNTPAYPPSGKTMYQHQQQQQQQPSQHQMRPPLSSFSTDSYERYAYAPAHQQQQQSHHQHQHQQMQYPNLPRGQGSPVRMQRPGEMMSSGRPSEASSEVSSSNDGSTTTPVTRTINRIVSQNSGFPANAAGTPGSPQEAWTCTVCTLKNNPNFLSCEACRSVRIR